MLLARTAEGPGEGVIRNQHLLSREVKQLRRFRQIIIRRRADFAPQNVHRIVTGTDPMLDGGIAGASNDSEASFEARRMV